MLNRQQKFGRRSESIAARILKREGYRILERNYRTDLGEIDIIARENKVLCFIEVKTRKNLLFGQPYEYVDKKKQRKILLTAQSYISKYNLHNEEIRFDVMSIHIPEDKGTARYELIRDAF